jgi:hypothetical protein
MHVKLVLILATMFSATTCAPIGRLDVADIAGHAQVPKVTSTIAEQRSALSLDRDNQIEYFLQLEREHARLNRNFQGDNDQWDEHVAVQDALNAKIAAQKERLDESSRVYAQFIQLNGLE